MRSDRVWRAALAVAASAACSVPAVAIADSGPSAGDNQYTDPLAGLTTSTPKKQASKPHTKPTSNATTVTTITTTTTTTVPPPVVTPTVTSTAPVASTHHTAGKTLPYTGYDLWLVVGVGAGLVGTGVAIRRRTRGA